MPFNIGAFTMKGLMVTLLFLGCVNIAQAQTAERTGGKFVLRLNDDLIADLKNNKQGLIAQIPPELQGKITEVAMVYERPTGQASLPAVEQKTTVARQELGFKRPANPNRGDQFSNPTNRGDQFTANRNQGNPFTSAAKRQTPPPAVPGSEEPIPGQDWLPVGDYTDFVPVQPREEVATQVPDRRVATNRDLNRDPNRNQPNFRTDVAELPDWDPVARQRATQRDRELDEWFNNTTTPTRTARNNRIQTPEFVRPNDFDTAPTFDQMALEQERQRMGRMMDQYQQKIVDLEHKEEELKWATQKAEDAARDAKFAAARAETLTAQPYAPGYYADNFDPTVENSPIPNNRVANRNNNRRRPTSLAIPGHDSPDQERRPQTNDNRNAATGPIGSAEIVDSLNSYKRTNGFLLFMLLCSVGINLYLGLVSRNFYTRYAELADELRETFTATM